MHQRKAHAHTLIGFFHHAVVPAGHGSGALVVGDVLAIQPVVPEAGPDAIVTALVPAQAERGAIGRDPAPAHARTRVTCPGKGQQRVAHRPPRSGQRPADLTEVAIDRRATQPVVDGVTLSGSQIKGPAAALPTQRQHAAVRRLRTTIAGGERLPVGGAANKLAATEIRGITPLVVLLERARIHADALHPRKGGAVLPRGIDVQQRRLGTQFGRARRTVVLAPTVVVHQRHMGIALAIQRIDVAAQAACQPVVVILLPAGQRQCTVVSWRHGSTLEQLRIGHRCSVKVQRPLRVIRRHQAGSAAPQQGIGASLLRCYLVEHSCRLVVFAQGHPDSRQAPLGVAVIGSQLRYLHSQHVPGLCQVAFGHRAFDQAKARLGLPRLHGKHALVITARLARLTIGRRPVSQQHQVIGAAFATRQAGLEQAGRFSRTALCLQLLCRSQGHAAADTLLQRMHVSVPGPLRHRAQAVQSQRIAVTGLQEQAMGITGRWIARLALYDPGECRIGFGGAPQVTQAVGQLIDQPWLIGCQGRGLAQHLAGRRPVLTLHGLVTLLAQACEFQAAAQAGELCLLPKRQAVEVRPRLVGRLRLVHTHQAAHGTFVIRCHAPNLQELPLGGSGIALGQRDIRQAQQGVFLFRALLASLLVEGAGRAQVFRLQCPLPFAEQGPILAGRLQVLPLADPVSVLFLGTCRPERRIGVFVAALAHQRIAQCPLQAGIIRILAQCPTQLCFGFSVAALVEQCQAPSASLPGRVGQQFALLLQSLAGLRLQR